MATRNYTPFLFLGASEPISYEQFLRSWKQTFARDETYASFMEYVRENPVQATGSRGELPAEKLMWQMGVNEEILAELEAVCSEEQLYIGDIANSEKLPETARFLDGTMEPSKDPSKFNINSSSKSSIPKPLKFLPPLDDVDKSQPVVQYPEVLYRFWLHRAALSRDIPVNQQHQLRLHDEVEALGSNLLTQLRDVFPCVLDECNIDGDLSENPDLKSSSRARDLFRSGLIFAEGRFYNDMRYDDCRDYSIEIRDWLRARSGAGAAADDESWDAATSCALMQATRVRDVHWRLGQPYLYLHQGDCEHLLTLADVRLLGPADPQLAADYPRFNRSEHRKLNFCRACHQRPNAWIVTGSDRTPEDPVSVCDSCFRAFFYSAKAAADDDGGGGGSGQKIGDFRAYVFPEKDPTFTHTQHD